LGIVAVTEVVTMGGLRWLGHVERKDGEEWVSACRYLEVEGSKGRGQRKEDLVGENGGDMKKRGLTKEMAKDRVVWRGGIHGDRLTRVKDEKPGLEKRALKR
jgi:hypothetical protein